MCKTCHFNWIQDELDDSSLNMSHSIWLHQATGMILRIPLLICFLHGLVDDVLIRHASQAPSANAGAVGATHGVQVGEGIKTGQVQAVLLDLLGLSWCSSKLPSQHGITGDELSWGTY